MNSVIPLRKPEKVIGYVSYRTYKELVKKYEELQQHTEKQEELLTAFKSLVSITERLYKEEVDSLSYGEGPHLEFIGPTWRRLRRALDKWRLLT